MMIAQKPGDLLTVWGCGESQQMTMMVLTELAASRRISKGGATSGVK